MEFQQGCLTNGVANGLVAVERAAKVSAIVPCATFDQSVVIARYAGDGGAGDKEVRYRGVPCVGRAHESRPRHQMFDEDRLQGAQAGKVLSESLKIIPKNKVAGRVRFKTVFVETALGDRAR